MEFDPNISPKHREMLRRAPQHRLTIFTGAIRSAKTVVSLISMVAMAENGPPGQMVLVGRTLQTLRRNVISVLFELFGDDYVKVNYGTGYLYLGDREFALIGADSVTAEAKIRGATFAGAYIDEGTLIANGGSNGREFTSQLMGRLSVKGARAIMTTNPGNAGNYWKTDYIDRASVVIETDSTVTIHEGEDRLDVLVGFFTLHDNPSLDPQYVDSLEKQFPEGTPWRDRFILGRWTSLSGVILSSWRPRAEHRATPEQVAESKRPGNDLIIGVDTGTSNPTAITVVRVDNHNQRFVIEHTLRLEDKDATNAEQVTRVLMWLRDLGIDPTTTDVYVDPSSRSWRSEWRAQTRKWPNAGVNDVLPGIQLMHSLAGEGRLLVADGNEIICHEAESWMWDSKAAENLGIDRPNKAEFDAHQLDSLRYALSGRKTLADKWRLISPPETKPIDRAFLP